MVDAGEIERAASVLDGRVTGTPVETLPGGLRVKREDLQVTGSFKARGVTNVLRQARPRAVIAGSSGNHGLALAIIARASGIAVTIVMTSDAEPHKREAIVRLGARVIESVGGLAARDALARELAGVQGLTYVSSHDDPLVIAGQATLGLELLELSRLTAVFVPVGGGGLLAGVALAIKAHRPMVRVIGVEPERADDFRRSLAAGRRVVITPPATVCDGARAQTPGALTFPIAQRLVDDIVVVPDRDVLHAVDTLAANAIRAEPTGALAVAGALVHGTLDRAVAIVSGGNVAERPPLPLTTAQEPA